MRVKEDLYRNNIYWPNVVDPDVYRNEPPLPPINSIRKMRSKMTDTNPWHRELGIIDDDASFIQNRIRFLASHSGPEAITLKRKFNVKVGLSEFGDSITELLTDVKLVSSAYHNNRIIEGVAEKHPVLITIAARGAEDDDWAETPSVMNESVDLTKQKIITYFVEATGHRQGLAHVFSKLETIYAEVHLAQVKWWYSDGHQATYKNIFLDPIKTQLRPEFYPDLGDPAEYLRRYLASEAPVLLVAGPPGTGKTTLLRHLITDFKLSAHVVYDEALMQKDTVFQSFLFEKESDIIIIEDADLILNSRERDNNKLMARFLNVSDGLIKLPDKKLVFTTNMTNFEKIDEALIRPGRCFGFLHTRKLNLVEAQAAAKVARLPVPTEKKEYTIAELFNPNHIDARLQRVGF